MPVELAVHRLLMVSFNGFCAKLNQSFIKRMSGRLQYLQVNTIRSYDRYRVPPFNRSESNWLEHGRNMPGFCRYRNCHPVHNGLLKYITVTRYSLASSTPSCAPTPFPLLCPRSLLLQTCLPSFFYSAGARDKWSQPPTKETSNLPSFTPAVNVRQKKHDL